MESNSKNITFEQLISASKPSKDAIVEFEYDDSDMYDFPFEDEVPENSYASMIMDISNSHNRNGDLCYDVCYKIFPLKMCNEYNNGYIDKISYHYIRQRYRKGSQADREFRKAMYHICNSKKYTRKELIGVIEVFHLIYKSDGSIGSIQGRLPSSMSSNWFIDDISDEFINTSVSPSEK